MTDLLKKNCLHFLFQLCLFLSVQHLSAQTEYINFRHYSLKDGLSSYKVVKVLQDRFGFMWIATQDGLNRFDGKDIIIYNKSAERKQVLAGTDITDILEDTSRNLLWVISSYGGLNAIDLETGNVKLTRSVFDANSHFPDTWLKCLALHQNEIWIGTYNGITVYDPGKDQFKEMTIPFPKNKNSSYDVNLFYKDEYDRMWAFISDYGRVIYSANGYTIVSFSDLPSLHLRDDQADKQFNDCLSTGPNEMLLATHQGLKRIVYDRTGPIETRDEVIPGVGNNEITSLTADPDHDLWFATLNGLHKLDHKTGNCVVIKDVNRGDQKKWLYSINSLLFDKQKNLWLGTLQGFAMAAQHTGFLNYFQSADLKAKINRAFYVFPYNDSVEYVCAEDGFYRVDNASDNIQQLKNGESFSLLFRHKDGQLILSGANHLYVFQPPARFIEIEKIYPELAGINNEPINSAVYWRDSLLFMGSENEHGMYEWDYTKKQLKKIDNQSAHPLKNNIVNTVYKDKADKVWILSDNSFALYDPETTSLINYELKNPATDQSLSFFFDICETTGAYWLACYGSGIVQLDKQYQVKKIISTPEGLTNAGVYKLFPVNDTFLFSTSNNGLCRINLRDLSVSGYFESDGLHSNAFEEACGMEKDKKIYAGGPDGFTIIDTRYLGSNPTVPAVYINKITTETKKGVSDSSGLFIRTMTFPGNALRIIIHFSGINYLNPSRTVFAYRITEQHKEWINLGDQNTLPLIGLPPGTYTLQVRAANEDGKWSDPVELKMIFLPKWYQTGWFKVAMILIAVGIIYALYNYRIGQLKKMMRVRTKISQDLHDEVGSSLSGIGLMSEMAKQQLGEEKMGEVKNSLEKISAHSGEVLTMMSDIVWAINPRNDTFEKMTSRLKNYAINTAASQRIQLHFEVGKDLKDYDLTMQRRKNIYLICKEAINNATRYSGCRHLYLLFNRDERHITIQIKDDGKGFDKLKPGEGNGLLNMQARADEIKAVLQIASTPGNGTSIQLLLKIT